MKKIGLSEAISIICGMLFAVHDAWTLAAYAFVLIFLFFCLRPRL
ncbi:MAG: hypothetical protein AB1508_02120 [Pseudomonadota bacterium]